MEEIFKHKSRLNTLDRTIKKLIERDKQRTKDKAKGAYTQDQIEVIRGQLSTAVRDVKSITQEIKKTIELFTDETPPIIFKSGEELIKINPKDLSMNQVSKLLKQFESFQEFEKSQEVLAPEQAKKQKTSAIRQAFEDYFFFVDDANTYIQGELSNEGLDQNVINEFSKWFVDSKAQVKNFLQAEDNEVSDKIKNIPADRIGQVEDYLKNKMTQIMKTTDNEKSTTIRQKILEKHPIPDSLRKLFPDIIPSSEQPSGQQPEESQDVEELARQKLEKEEELYKRFKQYLKNPGEVIDADALFDDLLSENEERPSIQALMDELDEAKKAFKAQKNADGAKRYVRVYEELKDRLQISFATPDEGKDIKEFDKPTPFATFLSRYYDYHDIKELVGIEELEIRTYQFILYLFIRYGISKKVNESKFKLLPGFDIEDYKKLKAAVIPLWDTTGGRGFKHDQQTFVDLSHSDIMKILKGINKRYKSYPFRYTGDITDKVFISKYFRITTAEPDSEAEQEKEAANVPEVNLSEESEKLLKRFMSKVLEKRRNSAQTNEALKVQDFIKNTHNPEGFVTSDEIRDILREFDGKERNFINNILQKFETFDQLMKWSSERGLDTPPEGTRYPEQGGSSDEKAVGTEDKEEIEFKNLQQIATFLWNKVGHERVKYKEEIAEALNNLGPIFYQEGPKHDKYKITEFKPDGDYINMFGVHTDDGPDQVVEVDVVFLKNGHSLHWMLKRLSDDDGKPLVDYVVKSGSLVTRILRNLFGGDTPLNEQLEEKLKPIIKEVMKESYG